MKSILIRYLFILQSITHIPTTLQSFGSFGGSRDIVHLTPDDLLDTSHPHPTLSQGLGSHEGQEAIGKGMTQFRENDVESIYKEGEQKRIENLSSSLRKMLKSDEQTEDELKELRDFLFGTNEIEPVKFARFRNALSHMMLEDAENQRQKTPDLQEEIEVDPRKFEGHFAKIATRIKADLREQKDSSAVAQFNGIFFHATHDFYLIVNMHSLMKVVENPDRQIIDSVKSSINTLYFPDVAATYHSADDRIVHALWTAKALLGHHEISEDWIQKLEVALRNAAENLPPKIHEDFIRVCKTYVFGVTDPNKWLINVNSRNRQSELAAWATKYRASIMPPV